MDELRTASQVQRTSVVNKEVRVWRVELRTEWLRPTDVLTEPRTWGMSRYFRALVGLGSISKQFGDLTHNQGSHTEEVHFSHKWKILEVSGKTAP